MSHPTHTSPTIGPPLKIHYDIWRHEFGTIQDPKLKIKYTCSLSTTWSHTSFLKLSTVYIIGHYLAAKSSVPHHLVRLPLPHRQAPNFVFLPTQKLNPQYKHANGCAKTCLTTLLPALYRCHRPELSEISNSRSEYKSENEGFWLLWKCLTPYIKFLQNSLRKKLECKYDVIRDHLKEQIHKVVSLI